MYHFFKDDPWGNKVPWLSVNSKDVADRLLRTNKDIITKVVCVPRNVKTLIKM